MTRRNLDQNGHHLNFDTEMCVHCNMTFNQLDDAGMPRCQGTPGSRSSHGDEHDPLLANLGGASVTLEDRPWWYGFRQIDKATWAWRRERTYRTRKEALRFYDSAKVHRDAHVIPPFQVRDRAEADTETERIFKSWPRLMD